ncbi:MAG: hypothetical protein JRF70_17470 [Deltaproteobacteria bacterium]|nr:hypothetical protein [Deltaproteobacteria bacterium]
MSAFAARLLVGVVLALGLPAAADPSLGFVHVEANVGGASGGHTALLLGDRVYHFQLGEERLLELHREDWDLFRFRYNELQNRPLHVAYVPVDAETLQQVRDHLTGLHLDYARVDGELAALEADLAALEALLGRRTGVPTRGAGLLEPGAPAPSWAVGLAERVSATLGPGAPWPRVGHWPRPRRYPWAPSLSARRSAPPWRARRWPWKRPSCAWCDRGVLTAPRPCTRRWPGTGPRPAPWPAAAWFWSTRFRSTRPAWIAAPHACVGPS